MSYPIRTRDQHFTDPGPKRILSLDGGGLRGIVTRARGQLMRTDRDVVGRGDIDTTGTGRMEAIGTSEPRSGE